MSSATVGPQGRALTKLPGDARPAGHDHQAGVQGRRDAPFFYLTRWRRGRCCQSASRVGPGVARDAGCAHVPQRGDPLARAGWIVVFRGVPGGARRARTTWDLQVLQVRGAVLWTHRASGFAFSMVQLRSPSPPRRRSRRRCTSRRRGESRAGLTGYSPLPRASVPPSRSHRRPGNPWSG